MKNLLNRLLFGKDAGVTIALCGLLLFALACKCGNMDLDDKDKSSSDGSSKTASNRDDSPKFPENSSKTGDSSTTPRGDSSKSTSPFPETDRSTDKSGDKSSDLGSKTSNGGNVSDSEAQDLARETLMDFTDAVRAGDFNDFHAKTSKPLQKQVSAASFESGFSKFIEKKDQVTEILDKIPELDAKFTDGPTKSKEAGFDVLEMEGSYDTSTTTNFKLKYVKESGIWKLLKIEVKL